MDLNVPDDSQPMDSPIVNNNVTVDSRKRKRRKFEAIYVDVSEEPP